MKVLVVGNGGREHAICRALAAADPKPEIIVAPGNPGTSTFCENVSVAVEDVAGLVRLSQQRTVDLVLPGPEAPLVAGLSDALAEVGIPCCGPSRAAAQLEGSKAFTRDLTVPAGVPSPRYAVVSDEASLRREVNNWDGVPVVKADGLAAGKGVLLPDTKEACIVGGLELLSGSLGSAGRKLVLEERLVGVEASLFYACNGLDAVALPHARDHKRIGNGDTGPNTGGMGAISPNPLVDDDLNVHVWRDIVSPTLRALHAQGTPFVGFLFVGLMLTESGPKLLEYNVRLGDPEAQAILPRIADGQFLPLCHAAATGNLAGFTTRETSDATCVVVLSAQGYPSSPRKGDPMTIDPALETTDRWLIHAGTAEQGGQIVTAGGRVATVVARGENPAQARQRAYAGVDFVKFDGMHARTDIGADRAIGE